MAEAKCSHGETQPHEFQRPYFVEGASPHGFPSHIGLESCPGPAPAVPHRTACDNTNEHEAHTFKWQDTLGVLPRAVEFNCPGVAVPHPETQPCDLAGMWCRTHKAKAGECVRSTSPQHDAPGFDAWVEAKQDREDTSYSVDLIADLREGWNAALASQPVHHDADALATIKRVLNEMEVFADGGDFVAERIAAALRSKADSQKEAGPHPSYDVPTLPEQHTTKADSSDALAETVLKAFADEDALFEKQKNGPGYAAWVEKWRDNQRRGRQWSLELAAALRSLGAKERPPTQLTHYSTAGLAAELVRRRDVLRERIPGFDWGPKERNLVAEATTVERVARAMYEKAGLTIPAGEQWEKLPHNGSRRTYWTNAARIAIAALLDSGEKA